MADRRLYEEKRARRPPAAAASRGRRRLLLASGLALAVLGLTGGLEWRRLRSAPPPPAVDALLARPAGEPRPLAEIVVRDEEELVRLREEVKRLQAALVEPRPAKDRGLYEARIRDLETRLAEAGDERLQPAAPAESVAPAAGGSGLVGATENSTGMQIGERRLREGLELPAATAVPHESTSASDGASAARATAAADGGGGGARGLGPRIEPPQLLRAIRPAYPPMARARRRMATVELQVRVDAAGKVVAVTPLSPPAGFGFDESAREAALSARFRPGSRDGEAVEMETRLAIRFLLEGPPR